MPASNGKSSTPVAATTEVGTSHNSWDTGVN